MFDPLRAKTKVVLYTTLAFLFGLGLASSLDWTTPSHAAPTFATTAQVSDAEVRPALDLSEAFIRVAEQVTPAVVRIDISRPVQASSQRIPEPFRPFFRDPEGGGGDAPDRQFGGGSGFLISADGYIMTNNHVVADADEINVRFLDGRVQSATLVGADPTTDVAVIRVDGSSYPFLAFGSSDEVRVGEWVLAVGNPGFGGGNTLDYTVTAGIVSAKGRPLQLLQNELQNDPRYNQDGQGSWAIEDFIQTDAVINPGNSGGPMVDLRGQVVGINSAIASRTGYYQGYGFAVPIDLARRVAEDLIEYGTIRRPWIGISMQSVDQVVADGLGLPRVSGARVTDVRSGGPAARAGLRSEDVITKLDGTDIAQPGQLQNLIARHRPGDEVELEYYRAGERRQVDVRLGEAPINDVTEPVAAVVSEAADTRIGIRVQELNRELAEEMGYEETGGVVITEVERYSAAWRRSLPVGWKVLEINGQATRTQEDVRRALGAAEPGAVVNLTLQRPTGETQRFYVRVPS
ncbi:MAG: trypsin-like peptidase domain-containing protein [Gemmatimonadota bacterium]